MKALLFSLDLDASRAGVQLEDGPAAIDGAVGEDLAWSPAFLHLDLQLGEIGIYTALLPGVHQSLHRHLQPLRDHHADVADRSLDARLRHAPALSHELRCDATRARTRIHTARQSSKLNVATAGLRSNIALGGRQTNAATAGFYARRAAHVADVQ